MDRTARTTHWRKIIVSRKSEPTDEAQIHKVIDDWAFADPDGNGFCVVRKATDQL
jgi:hypothetical protein